MKRLFFALMALLFLPALSSPALAQTWTAKGRVLLDEGVPIENIVIKAAKSKSEARSDSAGYFEIEVLESDKLVIKNKPFASKSLSISKSYNSSEIVVKLDLPGGDDKVDIAIGYGYISEANRIQAVQVLKMKNSYAAYSDIWNLFKEKFTNIQIVNGNCVIVRGAGTFNGDPCAIFVVDGVIEENINYLVPSMIKDVTLLKDGTSSIYGARAANGVFLINTYKGE